MDNDYEAFISYRHKECNELAKAIHDELLEAYDINSFRDDEGLHFGDFRQQLIKNNKRSNFLVLLLTSETLERCNRPKDWITTEVTLFLERGKPIIPVLLSGFELSGNVPKVIAGLEAHTERSIRCSISDPREAARYIAKEVRNRLRAGWSEKAIAESYEKKPYLSKENVSRQGYYYQSANELRKSVTVFLLYLAVLVLVTSLVFTPSGDGICLREKNVFYIYMFSMLNGAIFFWQILKTYDEEIGEKVPLLEYAMDGPIKSSLLKLLFSFFLAAFITVVVNAILGSLVYICSIATATVLFPGATVSIEAGEGWTCMIFVPCLLLPVINGVYRVAISLANYINCLFARYPKKYKNWVALKRANKIKKILSFIIYPVVSVLLGAAFLAFVGVV